MCAAATVRHRPRRERAYGATSRGTGGRSGDAEVHHQAFAVGVHHDVGGLEVAVHDTGLVRLGESGHHTARDGHHAFDRQLALALQDGRQVLALEVRHRDVLEAVDLADVVHADDVLVRDLAGEQQLLLEPLLEHAGGGRIVGHLGPHGLERHGHAQFGVPRLVHRAHAAGAEQLDDVVAITEVLADEIGGRLAEAAGRLSWASPRACP